MHRSLFFLIPIILVAFLIIFLKPDAEAPVLPTPIEPEMATVTLYYYNIEEDRRLSEGIIACSPEAVLGLERTVGAEEATIEKTLELLLRGELSETERSIGFTSEFPREGFRFISAEISAEGIATLEFSEVPGFTSGGACRIGLLRAQIEKTAQQFSGVSEVRFMPEELFQP